MGIAFERGAFENPDDPWHDDDVDSAIVVVTDPDDRVSACRAVQRCTDRWRGIDGAGRHHSDGDAFWDAQPRHDGPEWHTAKFISEPTVTEIGVEVDVDARGFMPAPMRAAYRRVLVEELEAVGLRDAVVRSQHADEHRPADVPSGPWPPYVDRPVPGLPPGVPPGRLVRHDLQRHSHFRNWLLQRDFDDVWEASAVAVVTCGEEEAVRRAGRRFHDAGWAVGQPQAYADWDRLPLTAAAMACPGAVAVVTCQAAEHVRGRGLRLAAGDRNVVIAVAYYDLEPPTDRTPPEALAET